MQNKLNNIKLWGQLNDQLWRQLGIELQLNAELGDPLWVKLRAQLNDQLWSQLGEQLGNQILTHLE